MKRSLFFRQLAVSAGLILLNLLLLGFSFSLISYRYVVEERRSRLDETAQTVAEMAVPPLVTCRRPELNTFTSSAVPPLEM